MLLPSGEGSADASLAPPPELTFDRLRICQLVNCVGFSWRGWRAWYDRPGGWRTSAATCLDAEIADWCPSELGQGLLDLTLRWIPRDAPSLRARPIVERWLDGAPPAPNVWAEFDAWGRDQWLTCVRKSGHARHHRPDQPPCSTCHLDGRYITDEAAFYCALGEAVNGPGGYFGGNLDALADCLRGRFGVASPFTLVWHASDVARQHLSSFISHPDGKPYSYFDKTLKILSEHGIEVVYR